MTKPFLFDGEAFISSSPFPIMICDTNRNILFFNSKFQNIFPHTIQLPINLNCLFHSHTIDNLYSNMDFTAGSANSDDLNLITKEGLFYKITPQIYSENKQLILFYLQQEKSNFIKNKLEETTKRLELVEKIKNYFISNLSHEIRTPMNGIIGLSSLILDSELPSTKINLFLQMIQQTSFDLLAIINNVIDVTHIESNELSFCGTEVFLNNLLDEIHKNFQNKIKISQMNIQLKLTKALEDINSIIITDEHKLKQSIRNLLDNAIKFTEKGEILFGYKLSQENQLTFFVRDTGIGIPSKDIPDIFKTFHQGTKAQEKHYGGLGLGLSISKAYVNFLKGDMEVHSNLLQGTSFYFSIPYDSINKPLNLNYYIKKNEFDWFGKTIAIIEDDPISSLYLKEILTPTSCRISSFSNGDDFLQSLKQEIPHLILLDLQIPNTNGLEIAKILKKSGHKIHIIVQTAYSSTDNQNICFESGCDDYISKPVEKKELLEKINRFFENR